jgi:hypothetical protein
MTWSDIGVLAELLGAIGVIVSLIYLSRQVRQKHAGHTGIGRLSARRR